MGALAKAIPEQIPAASHGSMNNLAMGARGTQGSWDYYETLAGGMGAGPALALLLAGPALSLPSMLVIHGVLGTRKTVMFILLVVVITLLELALPYVTKLAIDRYIVPAPIADPAATAGAPDPIRHSRFPMRSSCSPAHAGSTCRHGSNCLPVPHGPHP